MNQGVKEGCPVAFAEDKALMASNDSAGGFGERGEAEIGQAATFESGGSLNKVLGLSVDAEAQAVSASTALGGRCKVCGWRHGIAP
jgi:hypothetical protein